MRIIGSLTLLIALLLLGACGDDNVVAYSETVSTKLSGIKAGDVDQGSASEQKNINTESKNPYGAFLQTARSRLGRDPAAIEVTSIIVRVDGDSKNVIAIDQVLGDVEVFFADSQTTIPIGHVDGPEGSSIVIPVDEVDLEPIMAAMLGGDFKVGVRGNAVASPPAEFELKLTLDVRFRAVD